MKKIYNYIAIYTPLDSPHTAARCSRGGRYTCTRAGPPHTPRRSHRAGPGSTRTETHTSPRSSQRHSHTYNNRGEFQGILNAFIFMHDQLDAICFPVWLKWVEPKATSREVSLLVKKVSKSCCYVYRNPKNKGCFCSYQLILYEK